jgi:hypothetical protein
MWCLKNMDVHFLKYSNCSEELIITVDVQNVSFLLLNILQVCYKRLFDTGLNLLISIDIIVSQMLKLHSMWGLSEYALFFRFLHR